MEIWSKEAHFFFCNSAFTNMSGFNSLVDWDDSNIPQSPVLLREDFSPNINSLLDVNLIPEHEESPRVVEEAELQQQQQSSAANATSTQPTEESGIIDITKECDGSDDSDSDIEILPGANINPLPPLRTTSQRRPISAHYEPYFGRSNFKQITSRSFKTWKRVSAVYIIMIP